MTEQWDTEIDLAYELRWAQRERHHPIPIGKESFKGSFRRHVYCLDRLPLPWHVFNRRARAYVRGVES